MASDQKPVVVEYVDDSSRRILRFTVASEGDLGPLKSTFDALATGAVVRVDLMTKDWIISQGRIGTLQLELIGDSRVKSKATEFSRDASGKITFQWSRNSEGWRECSELLSALTLGSHQYFNYGFYDEVAIEVSCGE